MEIKQVKEFLRDCSHEERNEIVRFVNNMHRAKVKNAKSQFAVGDVVTSDDPRWYYGEGVIEKIKVKNILVNCGGRRINVAATLLKHAR